MDRPMYGGTYEWTNIPSNTDVRNVSLYDDYPTDFAMLTEACGPTDQQTYPLTEKTCNRKIASG